MGIGMPAWLEALYSEQFFVGCSYHETSKKNEKNVCCLDCCSSICPHCVSTHRHHRLLQVRRYVYHNVVRLEDLQKLIDCSYVQAYTINSAKVIFIKKRRQNRQFKGAANYCTSCDRSLQQPYIHCSLACKVEFALKHYKDLSAYLRPCKTLKLGPDFLMPQDMVDDEVMTTHSTIVDSDDDPMSWSSSGSDSTSVMYTEVVRKKRSGVVYVSSSSRSIDMNYKISHQQEEEEEEEDMATSMSRRKGIPHRSPLS